MGVQGDWIQFGSNPLIPLKLTRIMMEGISNCIDVCPAKCRNTPANLGLMTKDWTENAGGSEVKRASEDISTS